MPTGPKGQRRPADVIGNAIRWLRSRPGPRCARLWFGKSWRVAPGVIHEVKAGDRAAKVVAIYVAEKGKPLATPHASA